MHLRKRKEKTRRERLSKERRRVESERIVLVVWYKGKWNRKLEEKKIYIL